MPTVLELFSFLSPNTILDWVFLVAIILCFVVTIIAAIKVRKSTKELIRTSSLNISLQDESSIRSYLANPKLDSVLESGASFALIIGLLGTFIGIGLAIQDASKVIVSLNNASNISASFAMDTVGQLSPVLSDIGTKFKVSAWGISVHILMRLFIPLLGIETIRHKFLEGEIQQINKNKLQRKEKIDNEIQAFFDSNKSINEAILVELKNVVSTPKRIEDSLSSFEVSVRKHNLDSKTAMDNLSKVIESLKNSIVSSLSKIDNSIDAMDLKANDSFDELTQMNKTLVTESMHNLKATNEQATKLVDSIYNLLNLDNFLQINQGLTETNDSLNKVAQNLSSIETIVTSAAIPISEEMVKIDKFLQGSLSNARDIQKSIDTNDRVIKSIEDNMQLLEKVNRNLLRLSADRKIMLDEG